jgi:hypothetical protein
MALAGEAGELEESARVMDDPGIVADVESELAGVLQYLIRLADVLGGDLAEAVRRKMRLNETRFPVDKASIHRPIRVARFRLDSCARSFCEVIPGAGVLPLAGCAACPGFRLGGGVRGGRWGRRGCRPVRGWSGRGDGDQVPADGRGPGLREGQGG